MSDVTQLPLTQAHVENEIMRLSHRLDELTNGLGPLAQEAGRTEAMYKYEFAKAVLRQEGPKGHREYQATVLCHQQCLSKERAEAVYRSQKEVLETIRSQLHALQTIAANIRAQT